MALSPKIKNEKPVEQKIEKLILKGGSSGEEIPVVNEETIKKVQLRISESHLSQIDNLVRQRTGKVSRHTWIMEAIMEKLGKEES